MDDTEADENEALKDDEGCAHGDDGGENDALYWVVDGSSAHGSDAGGLKSNGAEHLPALVTDSLRLSDEQPSEDGSQG